MHVIGHVDRSKNALKLRQRISAPARRRVGRRNDWPTEVQIAAAESRNASAQKSNEADLEPCAQAKRLEHHAPDPRHGGRNSIKSGQTVHRHSPWLVRRRWSFGAATMPAFPLRLHKPFFAAAFCRERAGAG